MTFADTNNCTIKGWRWITRSTGEKVTGNKPRLLRRTRAARMTQQNLCNIITDIARTAGSAGLRSSGEELDQLVSGVFRVCSDLSSPLPESGAVAAGDISYVARVDTWQLYGL